MKREVLVILDTSSLMAIFQTKVDLVSAAKELLPGRIKFAVTEETLRELKRLTTSKSPSVRKAAKAAMKIANEIGVIGCKGERGDEAVVKAAIRTRAVVATTDSELRKRLRDLGIPVIYPRKDRRFEVEGFYEPL